MVRRVAALACLAMLADCGGSSEPAPQTASTPAEVVFFQRQGAGGATLDTITVRANGIVTLQKRYGGAGGRFKDLALKRGQMARLERDLERLPEGSSVTRGTPPAGGAQYLLRLDGRTVTGRQGAIAPAARPAVRRLDGYIDGIGVRQVETDAATHRP